jgi:hypothetical protein
MNVQSGLKTKRKWRKIYKIVLKLQAWLLKRNNNNYYYYYYYYYYYFVCCSYLEHRKSVKRFVSLQFINIRQSVGLLRRGISQTQGRYLTQAQNKENQISMP